MVGGTEFFATDSISLNLEVRYEVGETVFREPLGLYRERVDMDAIFVGLGIKYYWPKKEP